jgi:hypothetical protein
LRRLIGRFADERRASGAVNETVDVGPPFNLRFRLP